MATWTSVTQAARASGLSEQAIRKRITTGKLPTRHDPGAPIMVDLDALPVRTARTPVESVGTTSATGCPPVAEPTTQPNQARAGKHRSDRAFAAEVVAEPTTQPNQHNRDNLLTLWTTEQETRRMLLDLAKRQDELLQRLADQAERNRSRPWLLAVAVVGLLLAGAVVGNLWTQTHHLAEQVRDRDAMLAELRAKVDNLDRPVDKTTTLSGNLSTPGDGVRETTSP